MADFPENQESSQSERMQELSIIVTDRIRSLDRRWWFALIAAFVACFPLYFGLRGLFSSIIVANHKFPAYIYQEETKVPLEVTAKKVFKISDNAYAGYIRIKNSTNFDWGVADQKYTAVFTTTGGTEVTRVSTNAFILPGTEKIIVFSRFTADREPTEINVVLEPTQFIRKPNKVQTNLVVERVSMEIVNSQLVVKAAVKNNTPFTIKRIGLPTLLYDRNNQVVGANYTNIDDVLYGETRSFQLTWPNNVGATRAEILPEVNIFDNNIYSLPPGSPQFETNEDNP